MKSVRSRQVAQNRTLACLREAIDYHQAGQFEAAKKTYYKVIGLDPKNCYALNNLGLLVQNEGNSNAAKDLFERAASLSPTYVEALNNLGNLYKVRGDFDAAVGYFQQALRANPDYALTSFNLGVLFESCGKFDQAIDWYRDSIRIDPTHRNGYLNLGNALQTSGLVDEAIACYQQTLTLYPDHFEVLNNLGTLRQSQGDFDAALACFETALAANPGFATTYFNLGSLFEAYGQVDRAIDSYRDGVRIDPNSAIGHLQLGTALQRVNQVDAAIAAYLGAIALQPSSADAFGNLGAALQAQSKRTLALAALQQALLLQPGHLDALVNLGNLMTSLNRIEEAATCYEQVLAQRPGQAGTRSNLLLALNYPDSISAQELARRSFAVAAWMDQDGLARRSPEACRPSRGRRLRVGYVSPDFRRHAVAYFLEPLMRAHDRTELEIFCYAEVSRPDDATARFQSFADHWRWTVNVSDDDLAAQIRADGINVLVDLAGHSARNRLPVFTRRPAPVQFTWLGYPGTTGLTSMDYRLVDAVTDPSGDADLLASETLIRIDGGFLCYQPSNEAPEPAPSPFLHNGFMTFGSFNNLAKLSNATLDVWGRLLASVPHSRLLLKSRLFEETEESARELVRLDQHGIKSDRVILLGTGINTADQLAAYRHVDIALDPFPYNGTTTTCETLWMGVPVVALLGDSHRGRVGASLLTRVGCTDLIAHDHAAYIRIAAELAADPVRLQALREQMRPRMAASSLCNAPAFARNIEAAYHAAWHRWYAVNEPAPLVYAGGAA